MVTDTTISAASAQAYADTATDSDQAEKDRLELLASVSHELGTPLTVIKANCASIRRCFEERKIWPEELNQREDDVELAVQRISALRDDLLAVSGHEPNELEIEPLDVGRSVQRVVRWARFAAVDKRLSLTETRSAYFPYAMGNEWAVDSVVGNLVSNAIRYTPAGGSISVETYNERDGVAVAVTDTGIGISEEARARLFERFYRAPEARKLAPYGLGVGLALARDLVAILGGTMEVESHPGAGSTFKMILPMASIATEDE